MCSALLLLAVTSFVDGKPISGNRVIVKDGINYVDGSVSVV